MDSGARTQQPLPAGGRGPAASMLLTTDQEPRASGLASGREREALPGAEPQLDLLLVGLGRTKASIRAEHPRTAPGVHCPRLMQGPSQLHLSGTVGKSTGFDAKWTPV